MGYFITEYAKDGGKVSYSCQVRITHKKQLYTECETFSTRKLAEQFGINRSISLKAELKGGRHQVTKPSDVTIRTFLTYYLEHYNVEGSENYSISKNYVMNRLLNCAIADLSIEDITINAVLDHIKFRLTECSNKTVAHDIIYIKSTLEAIGPLLNVDCSRAVINIEMARKFARKHKLIVSSGVRDVIFEDHEIKQLIAHVDIPHGNKEIPYKDVILFALYSARRETEITMLRWEDWDKKNHTILVRHLKNPNNDKMAGRAKLLKEAEEIISRQPRNGEFIFPYNPRSISKGFKDFLRQLGMREELCFHVLRHTACVRFFALGYSIPEVQLFTLHKNWSTLQRYTKLPVNLLKVRTNPKLIYD